jgi:hypothetical protein
MTVDELLAKCDARGREVVLRAQETGGETLSSLDILKAVVLLCPDLIYRITHPYSLAKACSVWAKNGRSRKGPKIGVEERLARKLADHSSLGVRELLRSIDEAVFLTLIVWMEFWGHGVPWELPEFLRDQQRSLLPDRSFCRFCWRDAQDELEPLFPRFNDEALRTIKFAMNLAGCILTAPDLLHALMALHPEGFAPLLEGWPPPLQEESSFWKKKGEMARRNDDLRWMEGRLLASLRRPSSIGIPELVASLGMYEIGRFVPYYPPYVEGAVTHGEAFNQLWNKADSLLPHGFRTVPDPVTIEGLLSACDPQGRDVVTKALETAGVEVSSLDILKAVALVYPDEIRRILRPFTVTDDCFVWAKYEGWRQGPKTWIEQGLARRLSRLTMDYSIGVRELLASVDDAAFLTLKVWVKEWDQLAISDEQISDFLRDRRRALLPHETLCRWCWRGDDDELKPLFERFDEEALRALHFAMSISAELTTPVDLLHALLALHPQKIAKLVEGFPTILEEESSFWRRRGVLVGAPDPVEGRLVANLKTLPSIGISELISSLGHNEMLQLASYYPPYLEGTVTRAEAAARLARKARLLDLQADPAKAA